MGERAINNKQVIAIQSPISATIEILRADVRLNGHMSAGKEGKLTIEGGHEPLELS